MLDAAWWCASRPRCGVVRPGEYSLPQGGASPGSSAEVGRRCPDMGRLTLDRRADARSATVPSRQALPPALNPPQRKTGEALDPVVWYGVDNDTVGGRAMA